MIMHVNDLEVGEQSKVARVGMLERLSWLDKLPMAFGCGCLLGLSSPGFDIWWLAWVGLVPLLVLIHSLKSKMQAVSVGILFGMGYKLVSLCWILGLYPLQWLGFSDWIGFQAALFVWLVECVHQAILLAGFALFAYALPMRAGLLPHIVRPYFPYMLSIPVMWLFFQWLIGTSDAFLSVPLNQLAYSQSRQLEIIQLAKLGGSQLVEFIILMANAALAELFIERSGWVAPLASRVDPIASKVGAVIDVGLVAVILSIVFLWGRWEVTSIAKATALTKPLTIDRVPVPVAVIQGNVTVEDEKSGAMSAAEVAKRYAALIDHLGVAMLVLPEGVVNSNHGNSDLLLEQLKRITGQQKKEALVGSVEPVVDGAVNALRMIAPRNEADSVYVKRHLVPFGEFVPLGFLGDLVPQKIKSLLIAGGGFSPAKTLLIPRSIWGKVGASICVEVVYPRLIADEVRKGASVLINVSNLAWFHNSTLNRQVLAAAVFRAVENGRYLVLATNTGTSAVIDPSGFVSSASLQGKQGVLVDTVQFLYRTTPFTRMWWL